LNYQRGLLDAMHEPARRLVAGYVISSLGILLAISGGTWDVTNHLLNKPETFFSPPHAALYSGAGSALVGAIIVMSASRAARKTEWPAKLVLAGISLLLAAGPIDFAWHSAFGLDGLLSPPHAVLVSGMVAASVAAAIGITTAYPRLGRKALPLPLILTALLPVWISAAGAIHMFSLPFSETAFFNFNPEPRAGAIVATLGFPVITAAIIVAASALYGRRFGVVTVLGAAFILVGTLTSILPNDALWSTIPFYISAIIPLTCTDAIMSRWNSRYSILVVGAIAGLTFIILYYPLITHTYEEAMDNRTVWASLTPLIYFDLLGTVFPLVAVPAASAGIAGAIIGHRMAQRSQLTLLK
jgi:hypothetical protein